MASSSKPSRWAVEQFGDTALDVAKYVIRGLMRGQPGVRIVQAAARAEGATDNHPFGSIWNTRYQVIVNQFELADLPGFEMIKPKGASYRLAVVNGRVLIPFRHATSMNKPIGQAKLGSLIPRRIAVTMVCCPNARCSTNLMASPPTPKTQLTPPLWAR